MKFLLRVSLVIVVMMVLVLSAFPKGALAADKYIANNTNLYNGNAWVAFMADTEAVFRSNGYIETGTLAQATSLYTGSQWKSYAAGTRVSFQDNGYVK